VTEAGHVPLTAFDVTELASLTYDLRATRPAVHPPPQRTMNALWRAMRRKRK
jgi:hypothetical protein